MATTDKKSLHPRHFHHFRRRLPPPPPKIFRNILWFCDKQIVKPKNSLKKRGLRRSQNSHKIITKSSQKFQFVRLWGPAPPCAATTVAGGWLKCPPHKSVMTPKLFCERFCDNTKSLNHRRLRPLTHFLTKSQPFSHFIYFFLAKYRAIWRWRFLK